MSRAPDVRLEVVLGHPAPYAPGNVPLDEAVSITHRALSQVQRVLHYQGGDHADERQRLQLWASMLKRTMVSERVAVRARQHGFNLQVEAIAQRDPDSKWALVDAQELSASTEAQADTIIKLEEDLTVRTRQVNQCVWEVEELEEQLQEQEGQLQEREGQLQEREELDDITLRRELEVLSNCETSLERREAELEEERKALEDARAHILARELDADSQEIGLRDQEARLAAQERQLAERQM
jgi:hypothetical protein